MVVKLKPLKTYRDDFTYSNRRLVVDWLSRFDPQAAQTTAR